LPIRFAEVAAEELGAGFAGGADVSNGETRIVGHGDEDGIAVAGVAFEADLLGVHGFVGFKIVEGAAGSPSPRPQSAPIIEPGGADLC
jgi:hypothetical protein